MVTGVNFLFSSKSRFLKHIHQVPDPSTMEIRTENRVSCHLFLATIDLAGYYPESSLKHREIFLFGAARLVLDNCDNIQ